MAYVYRHIRLDKNIPFYIGIGTDSFYRRANSRAGRNRLWNRIAAVSEYDVEILFYDIELGVAKEKEIEFISIYKRINDGGTLANISSGGDGLSAPPKEYIDGLIERNRNNKHHLGKTHTTKAKIAIGRHSSVRNSGVNNPSYKGVVQVFKDGEFVGEYLGVKDCGEKLGINVPCISECVNGNRKTAKGFTFLRVQK